ncbi:chromosome segregation protein SMC [Shewanella inventionis]|uniref:Chromosome partition protein Smc n=1 Tax=Shewanella inventionis TaxID=1738770 RepID=A0ABQ1IS38_9GAMM|nr:chromosome segregation protein SMC [Shewanella inventionis]MCL1156860.1 chromosome segregation protein SMC [Shewanella inventionis]GGB51162.1 chromosome partition protein Smc [Shewanella inventionis]
MRLKQIKLAGFKSFVDPTKIPFDNALSAIIGPNGCGKSNVIDAVRWVLGESSAKNLRGDSMTDVIFNGSSSRKPISVAGVELVFENSQGRLAGQYASYQEISVKRQVNRDSESTYFLNGQKCRRKDITDLFMGTGLGPRSYAIIEQGTISRLIESKPQELRVFIEEAAGISRYKERRRETENRIRHTRENLERLNDIRVELGTQLDKLSQQAKAALQYRELKTHERLLHSQLLVMRYQELLSQTDTLDGELTSLNSQSEQLQATSQHADTSLTLLKQQLAELSDAEHKIVEHFYATGNQITKLEQQLKHQQQQDTQLQQQISALEQQLAVGEQKIATLNDNYQLLLTQADALTPQCEQAQMALEFIDEQLAVIEEACDEQQLQLTQYAETLASNKMQLALSQSNFTHQQQSLQQDERQKQQLEQELAALTLQDNQTQLADTQTQLAQIDTQLDNALQEQRVREQQVSATLQGAEQQREQYQTLKQTITHRHARLQLIEELLAAHTQTAGQQLWQVLDVQPGWEKAVAMVLHGLSQFPVLSHEESSTNPKPIGFTQGHTTSNIAFKTEVNLAPWLKSVTWVHTLDEAKRLLPQLSEDSYLATQDGYLVGQGFVLNQTQAGQSAIVLSQERIELNEQLLEFESQLNLSQQALTASTQQAAEQQLQLGQLQQTCHQLHISQTKLQSILASLQQQQHDKHQKQRKCHDALVQLEQAYNDKQMQIEAYEEQIVAQEEALSIAINQHEVAQHAWQNSQAKLRETKTQRAQALNLLTQHQAQLQKQQTQQALSSQQLQQQTEKQAELSSQYDQLQQILQQNQQQRGEHQLAQLSAQLTQTLEQQQALQLQLQQNRAQQAELQTSLDSSVLMQKQQLVALQDLTQKISALKLRREGLKGQANAQLQLLQEQQIQLQQVIADMPEHASVNVWAEQLEKVKQKIVRLGAINLAAIEEFETQRERKAYLDSQDDDLNKGLSTLEDAIRKIDKETKSRFKSTFEAVNHDLGQLFPKVFGGGRAYLALTDDDLLDTGVTIMAQPPGKKNSSIHLLSGGEKALTALSLVFAIFRLNPAPFCMLDEVDAPLDDANVERFCRLLQEMSQSVQFIYISHNKITMEMADQLIGVTMHEPGVSRIVAVDIEAAVALADAV